MGLGWEMEELELVAVVVRVVGRALQVREFLVIGLFGDDIK
jgi:hypothetical protein